MKRNDGYQVRIYLEDEVRGMGAGWRTFTVIETDDYTYLVDGLGRRARINSILLGQLIAKADAFRDKYAEAA